MAGELGDLDQIVKFGDPWHGLYRNGVIELPGGLTRAPAGTAPASIAYTWFLGYTSTRNGESYAVKVPGTPASTTSPSEAALGMSWLDYGILAGPARRLYGVAIGADSWLYVAPDKTVWLARLSTASADGKTLQVDFSPVMKSGDIVQSPQATLATPRASFPAAAWPRIADITSSGGDIIVFTQYSPESTAQEFFVAAARLEISGVPPAAVVTLTSLYDAYYLIHPQGGGYSDIRTEQRWFQLQDQSIVSQTITFDLAQGAGTWPAEPANVSSRYDPVTISRTYRSSGEWWIVGVGFDAADNLVWYTIHQEIDRNTPFDPPAPYGSAGGYSGTIVERRALKAGGTTGQTITLTFTPSGVTWHTADGYEYVEWTRYTNRAMGLILWGDTGPAKYVGAVSPAQSAPFSQTTRPGVTVHPLTGVMTVDLSGTPVCVI